MYGAFYFHVYPNNAGRRVEKEFWCLIARVSRSRCVVVFVLLKRI